MPVQTPHAKIFHFHQVALSEQDLDNIAKAVKALDRKQPKSEKSETGHATSNLETYFREETSPAWQKELQRQRPLDLLRFFGQQRKDQPQRVEDEHEVEDKDQDGGEDFDESWALKQARLDQQLQREREEEERVWQERQNRKFEPPSRGIHRNQYVFSLFNCGEVEYAMLEVEHLGQKLATK